MRADWDAWERDHELAFSGVTIPTRSKDCGAGSCDLFVFPASEPGYEISGAAFAMKPKSRGRLTLTSDDPKAPPDIDHGFLSDERDVPVLVEGFERLRELGRSEPARRYTARETRPGEHVPAEEHVRASARGFFHPTGTCRMGSVVDQRGRVYGYENLVVADASIMPAIPRANTNLTTAAIAEKLAETL